MLVMNSIFKFQTEEIKFVQLKELKVSHLFENYLQKQTIV